MSSLPYQGTLLLQQIQQRFFLTVSIWWADVQPGDVLTGGVVQPSSKRSGTLSYYVTKTSRLSQPREQRNMEIETLNVQDQDVVVFCIWRKRTLLASARYRIDASLLTCIPCLPNSEQSSLPDELHFTITKHVIDQPYTGILLLDQRKSHYYEPGNTVVTLTIYLWWEALYRGDIVVLQLGHHGWREITKTSFLDNGREQSMVEVEAFTLEAVNESFHVFIESGTGGTLAHTFFRADAQARAIVDVSISMDKPKVLAFEVLQRGNARTYTGRKRYRLCQRPGSLSYQDDIYEEEQDALAAWKASQRSIECLLLEQQTRWHTWEQYRYEASNTL